MFSQGPEIGSRGRTPTPSGGLSLVEDAPPSTWPWRNATDRPLPLLRLAVAVNRRVVRSRKLSIDSSEFEQKLMTKVIGASHNKVDDRS